jgi:hypothetical protein
MQKEKGATDISLLFAILTTLVALWFFLLSSIRRVSTVEPASASLMVLGVTHYCLFSLAATVAVVLWLRGVTSVSPKPRRVAQFARWADAGEQLLLVWWLPVAFAALLVLGVSRSMDLRAFASLNTGMLLSSALSALIVGVAVLLAPMRQQLSMKAVMTVVPAVLGYLPYIMVMSLAFADVVVETDRPQYQESDTVTVSVTSAGYLFNPDVRLVYFAFQSSTPMAQGEGTFAFVPALSGRAVGTDYISVEYDDQFLGWRRTRHVRVRIVESPAVRRDGA